jgi:5-bromo-4-chloroindolyl phosphate hydrolysis protein
MKNKEVISSVIGASFFAVGYLGLSVALLPAALMGAGAYVASELVINGAKKEIKKQEENNFKSKIEEAKKKNRHINEMVLEIDSDEVRDYMKDINKTTARIINTIEKNNIDNKTSNKFFDYYLPICVNIIDRYDEIENQELTSKDSKKFMDSSIKMIKETSYAFKKILDNLYEKDIYNNEAEMKVYNQMLKADGYDSKELNVEDGDNDE